MRTLKLIEADLQNITEEDIEANHPMPLEKGEKVLNSEVDPQLLRLYVLGRKYTRRAQDDRKKAESTKKNEAEAETEATKSCDLAELLHILFWHEVHLSIPDSSTMRLIGVRRNKEDMFVIVGLDEEETI